MCVLLNDGADLDQHMARDDCIGVGVEVSCSTSSAAGFLSFQTAFEQHKTHDQTHCIQEGALSSVRHMPHDHGVHVCIAP